jgi:cyclohexyl-isocyanide hydratase
MLLSQGKPMAMRFAFLLFPDLTQLDLTGPYEVFARTPQAEVLLVARSLKQVRSQWGMRFSPDRTFADCEALDVLVVPGGFGIKDTLNDAEYLRFIASAASSAQFMLGVRSGALLLGAAGLLMGRRATTHWAYRELLPQLGAVLDDERVVRDGSCITSGGVLTAGVDAALSVVAATSGELEKQRIEVTIDYRSPEPAPYAVRPEDVMQAMATRYRPRVAEMSVEVKVAAARLTGSLEQSPTPNRH